MSMPGPPHSEPPRCAGPDLGVGRQGQQAVVQAVEDRMRALALVHGEVGAGDVADEQRVARQHRPGLLAARGSTRANEVCSGRWPGVCIARTRTLAELQLLAVVERLVLVAPRRRRGARGSSRPWRPTRRPWPDRWSAWLCVSSTCSICDRRGNGPAPGTRRSRSEGRSPPPPRRARHPRSTTRSQGRRARSGGRSLAYSTPVTQQLREPAAEPARCPRTTAPRTISRAPLPHLGLPVHRRRDLDLRREAAGTLVLYVYPRTGQAGRAAGARLGRDPRRPRLHAGVLLVPRLQRRVGATRRARARPERAALRRSARVRGAGRAALPAAQRPRAGARQGLDGCPPSRSAECASTSGSRSSRAAGEIAHVFYPVFPPDRTPRRSSRGSGRTPPRD